VFPERARAKKKAAGRKKKILRARHRVETRKDSEKKRRGNALPSPLKGGCICKKSATSASLKRQNLTSGGGKIRSCLKRGTQGHLMVVKGFEVYCHRQRKEDRF